MTIQQLEYILAVDQFRHFARAAEYCRVTQPTLSAMIQKLEEELGVKLFDRTVQPVCPTAIGEKIIDQARVILAQTAQVKEIISEEKQSLAGVPFGGIAYHSTLFTSPLLPSTDGKVSGTGYTCHRNENTEYPAGIACRRY
jgi:DNA-binding transcriptional LysR family regulator